MTEPILVFDDVLPRPFVYRARHLRERFETVHDGPVVFHGMAPCADPTIPMVIVTGFPMLTPTLSFFRRSPEGQQEPHYLHDDRSMGDWTAIYYLSPDPPEGDGTSFFANLATGQIDSTAAIGSEAWQQDICAWSDLAQWERWTTVAAKFNRLVLFRASLFHARALPDNYGEGEDARLIQICFGTGAWV
jgi:hypothetical protein